MYVEDVDLCWRLRRAGWGVRYEPAARVVHEQGRSTSRHPYRMLVAHHRSIVRFADRSTDGPSGALLPLVAVALGARLVLASLRCYSAAAPHVRPWPVGLELHGPGGMPASRCRGPGAGDAGAGWD